ncbi:MAG: phosphoesterase, partial [Alphaproteobacteria bacterium]|nr:phosphoesterase [Alphaproteobacteria bacterium]
AFGEYMVQEGMIETFADRKKMTKQLVAEGKMIKKPEFGISAEEAIEAIHEAGGLAILAHPYRMKLTDNVLFEGIKELKSKGLDGVEAHYTNYKKDAMLQIAKTLRMAAALDLLVSGGSDYHKDKPEGRFQGNEAVPGNLLESLKRAHFARLG